MALSLGIRLVILLPSLLFLIGFGFKSIIERKHLGELLETNKEIPKKLWLDFLFLLSFDSIFLIIANGLIIIFELQNIEIGIILIIIGVIFSMCLLIGAHINYSEVGSIGIAGIFSIIGWEFGYFWSYNSDKIFLDTQFETGLPTAIIGLSIGILIINFSIPKGHDRPAYSFFRKKL